MAFPWGQKHTPLEKEPGPKQWQKKELLRIAKFIKENKERYDKGEDTKVYKRAVSSGRGIGKSALVAWLSLWQVSCNLGAFAIITANNESQLTGKTFAEIGKWHSMMLHGYCFERTQTKIAPAPWFAEAMHKARMTDKQYWYIDGVLWKEDDPDSFAGPHNNYGEMVIFDEASGIPTSIWNVTEPVFTESTPYKFFMAFGNPRSNSGQFFDCFHSHSSYWSTIKIDARTVEGTSQDAYQEIIRKYGENSRDARVEVRGEFPEHGDRQFISRSIVESACDRELSRQDDYAPLCLGIDVARFGDDSTCFFFRQGRDARSIKPIVVRGLDNMAVANKAAQLIEEYDPDGVFCDSGAGTGVIDRLREMGYFIHEVAFGSSPDSQEYFDHRTEIWGRTKDWLQGAMLDGKSEEGRRLVEELVGPEYEYLGREGKIKLESKEGMKKRLPKLGSPDIADALAVTFHCHVSKRNTNTSIKREITSRRIAKGVGGDVSFDGYGSGSRTRKAKGVGSDVNFD